jgi:hypothetical protein
MIQTSGICINLHVTLFTIFNRELCLKNLGVSLLASCKVANERFRVAVTI